MNWAEQLPESENLKSCPSTRQGPGWQQDDLQILRDWSLNLDRMVQSANRREILDGLAKTLPKLQIVHQWITFIAFELPQFPLDLTLSRFLSSARKKLMILHFRNSNIHPYFACQSVQLVYCAEFSQLKGCWSLPLLYRYTGRMCRTSVSHKNSGNPTPRIPLFAPATPPNESMLPKSTTSQRHASLIHASGSRNEDQRYEQCTRRKTDIILARKQSPFPRETAMLSNRQPRTSL